MQRDGWFKTDPYFGIAEGERWIPARTVTIWMNPAQHKAFCRTALSAELEQRFQTEIISLCADNIPYAEGISFSVTDAEWSEFETTPLYRKLAAYFGALRPETEGTHTERCEPEYTEENRESTGLFRHGNPVRLLLARVCTRFHLSESA